jgi:hypothetical protein
MTTIEKKFIAAELRKFASHLSAQHGFTLTMTVKEDTGRARMPHGRYLFTDQIALLVERGFDLLMGGDRIRDVEISLAADPSSVEHEMRDLPDAP